MEFQIKEIEELQKEIEERKQKIIKLRRAQALEEVKDYTFKNRAGEEVSLYSLFGDAEELLIMHNMGKSCPYCTMWADGFRGYAEMLSDRMPWALTSPDAVDTMKEFTEARNWDYNVLSFHGTSFAKDLGFEFEKEGKTYYWPGVSALIKKDGKVYRAAKESFGPGDSFNIAWHFFDLFPKGHNNWQPKYQY